MSNRPIVTWESQGVRLGPRKLVSRKVSYHVIFRTFLKHKMDAQLKQLGDVSSRFFYQLGNK